MAYLNKDHKNTQRWSIHQKGVYSSVNITGIGCDGKAELKTRVYNLESHSENSLWGTEKACSSSTVAVGLKQATCIYTECSLQAVKTPSSKAEFWFQ